MGSKERRERERQEVRARILDAARELFARDGYEAVTMRRIAARIEYTPTAIYLHFRDKETLIRELCRTDFEAFAQEFSDLAGIADPVQRLRRAGRAYVQFGLRYPNHYRLMFMTPAPEPLPGEDVAGQGEPATDAYAFLRWTIGDCLAAGRLRRDLTDPELVAQVAWAAVHGVVALCITTRGNPFFAWCSEEDIASLMEEVLIRGLTGEVAGEPAANRPRQAAPPRRDSGKGAAGRKP